MFPVYDLINNQPYFMANVSTLLQLLVEVKLKARPPDKLGDSEVWINDVKHGNLDSQLSPVSQSVVQMSPILVCQVCVH